MVKDLTEKYFEPGMEMLSFNEMMYELLEKHYNDCIGKSGIKPNYFIDFNFGQKMFGTGWYWREKLPDGTIYRWTGPELESIIDFILSKDKDLKIRFRIIDEAFPDNLKQLSVNNNVIKLVKFGQKGKKIVYEGLISKEALVSDTNFTRFTFIANQLLENQYPLGPIGIAIDKIIIYPADNE